MLGNHRCEIAALINGRDVQKENRGRGTSLLVVYFPSLAQFNHFLPSL